MPHSERGFILVIVVVIALLALATGGFLLKSQGKLGFSNRLGTNQSPTPQSPTPSGKTTTPDFATAMTAMKELGCSDPSSCMTICSKPENTDKCRKLMQAMDDGGQSNLDENNLPKIVQADFIDLDRINVISKFRSGAGHDFSYGDETCRSMKHYFYSSYPPSRVNPQTYTPKIPYINIYSPVGGVITSIDTERFPIGKQIHIQPSSQPELTILLFHVYPVETLKVGSKVSTGEKIGIIGADGTTDIAVQVGMYGGRLFSYFDVMSDQIFQHYKDRGLNSRDDVIISRQYRDQHPLGCTGQQFDVNVDNPEDNITLKPI